MRLRTSFRSAIIACAFAFGLAAPSSAQAQHYGTPPNNGSQFAGQQFAGRYPNIAPSPSLPNPNGAGPGYYAAAMQSGGRPPAVSTAPPMMPQSYPGPTPYAAPQPTAAPPASGPFAGLKSSLGKFANPAAPQIPAAPTSAARAIPSPRQAAWSGQAAPAAAFGQAASPTYRTQPAGYNAPASPYSHYAAEVAARATADSSTATPASYTAVANAAARPNVALQSRGPSYGSPYLQALNQPTLAPGLPVAAASAPGMPAQGGPAQGMPVSNAPATGTAGSAVPNYSAPGIAPPGATAPAGGGFVGPTYDVSGGQYGNPNVPNGSMWQQPAVVPDPVSGGQFGGGAYGGGPVYGEPNFVPSRPANYDPGVSYFAPGGSSCGPACGPWFASVSALIMTRDVPNNVGLAYLGADPHVGNVLNSETAGFDWKGGIEARLGRMIGDRWALETVWWGLDPSHGYDRVRSETNELNSRLDMTTVFYQGVPLTSIWDNSREQLVYRADSFQNIEINLLQQALVVDPANRFGMAYFTGVRYFRYREILDYYAAAANAEFLDGDMSTASGYHVRLRNSLIGWQAGARGHMYLGERLRLYATPRVGLFCNQISQDQELCMLIWLHSTKTDVAMLGQLDIGASWQLFRCCSIFAGYRVLGITGVANADDNIARDFNSQPDMANINSSGSIILHGVNTGIQFQF